MPITFESPKDRFGIGAAGSILGNALMQKNLENLQNQRQLEQEGRQDTRFLGREELQNQRQLEMEQRKIQQQKEMASQKGSILSQALEGADLSTPEGMVAFAQKLTQSGLELDPLDFIKTLSAERIAQNKPANQPKPSIFQKKEQEAAADWVNQVRDQGVQAQQMLKDLPQLKEAIYSPTLENQSFLNRWGTSLANKAGIGGAIMNDPEQVIATYGKSLVTDLSNLKGLRLTDTKLRWLENAVPAVGKTPEANKRAYQIVEDLYKVRAAMSGVVDQIIQENGGEPPPNIQSLVGEQISQVLNDYIEQQPDFKDGNKKEAQGFDSLPSASEYKGVKIKDNKTDGFYKSDGKTWKKVK